jgi:ribose transport system substrate-binding protein
MGWKLLVPLALVVAAVALAACGGSGDSSTGGGGGTESDSTEGGGEAASANVAGACERAKEASQEPVWKAPGGPTDGSVIKGKSVYAVIVFPATPVQAYMKTLKQAGSELGFEVTEYNAEGTVPKATAGIQQAIGRGADILIVLAVPSEALQKPLEEARAKGMTVVDAYNSTPDAPPPPGVQGRISWDYGEGGEARMAQAICETEGDLHAGLISSLDIKVGNDLKAGLEKEIADKCPETCSLTSTDVPGAKWATGVAPATANLIQGNPDINYLFPMFGGMATSALPTVKRVDPSGNIGVSSNDMEINQFGAVESGELKSDAGSDLGAGAWATVDQLIRLLNGEKPVIEAQPWRLLTTEVANELNLSSDESHYEEEMAKLFPSEYTEGTGYKKLWGTE